MVAPYSKFSVGAAWLTHSGKIIGGAMIGGACRQLLAEYAARARVFVADSRRLKVIREFSVSERLPGAFLAVP